MNDGSLINDEKELDWMCRNVTEANAVREATEAARLAKRAQKVWAWWRFADRATVYASEAEGVVRLSDNPGEAEIGWTERQLMKAGFVQQS